MRVRFIFLTVMLFTTGCQQMVWYKPGASSEDYQHDMSAVKYDSVKFTTPEDDDAYGIRRGQIIKAGMESKGWELVPAGSTPTGY